MSQPNALKETLPPCPLSVICFFTSLLKTRLIAQLLFAQESAMYPSETCMSHAASSAYRPDLLLTKVIGKD